MRSSTGHGASSTTRRALRDPTGESAEAFSASVALRTTLGQELGLGGDARKNLEGLVVVMSPLIGAILTRLGGL